MNKQENKVIVILGPTASGKTKLAVKLARDFSAKGGPASGWNGEIVSADSRQVYKGMDVGTGKDLKEYGPVSYHLIDIVSPKSQFSLAQYQKLAYQAIDDIIKRGKTPFLVGGTGLYIQAIVDGYQLSDVKPDKKLRQQLNKKCLKQLQSLAKKHQIKMNKSDFNNKRRLVRAIEIMTSDQRPLFLKNKPRYSCLQLGIKFPKTVLNKRIDQRLKRRLEQEGLIEEVRNLKKQGLSWQKLDDFGLEYRFIAKYLKGGLNYDQMVKKLATAIHQFAKRQLAWFKRDKRIKWVKNYSEVKKLIQNFI